MNVAQAIRSKRAVRRFKPDPLPDETARAILNAGRRSQSSKNTQPWQFIAVRDRETLKALSTLGDYAGHLAGAGLGVGVVTPWPDRSGWIMFDVGQCAAYMQLAAWELGIGSVIASIYEPEKAMALLGIPSNLHLEVMLSFGYPVDESLLAAPPKKGGRKPLEAMVHWEKW